MIIHKLTDADGYVADRATRYLMAALFDDPEVDDWQSQALCAQVDPDLFFPEKGGSVREARRVCAGCPVRAECLDYALENDERSGVWGGLSERERRPLVRISRAELMAEGERRCRTCHKIRSFGEFYRNSSTPDGLKASCKRCCDGGQRNRRRSIRCTSRATAQAA